MDFEDFTRSFTLTGTQTVIAPVNIIDDLLFEGEENFFGNLVGQVLPNIDYNPNQATATVIDYDGM